MDNFQLHIGDKKVNRFVASVCGLRAEYLRGESSTAGNKKLWAMLFDDSANLTQTDLNQQTTNFDKLNINGEAENRPE